MKSPKGRTHNRKASITGEIETITNGSGAGHPGSVTVTISNR